MVYHRILMLKSRNGNLLVASATADVVRCGAAVLRISQPQVPWKKIFLFDYSGGTI